MTPHATNATAIKPQTDASERQHKVWFYVNVSDGSQAQAFATDANEAVKMVNKNLKLNATLNA
jgi:hypothetical protein